MTATDRLRQKIHEIAEPLGNLIMELFHFITLFVIAGTIFWSSGVTFIEVIGKGHATVDDVLLLFIYLELGAMVGIYFKTNHMPVRFLIYVAITALTRMLISDIGHNHVPNMGNLIVAGATLLFALSTLVIRFGSARFPSDQNTKGDR